MNQPPPEVPVPDNDTEEMDIELESNETTPNDSSSSTVLPPSPTAATKGKEIEKIKRSKFIQPQQYLLYHQKKPIIHRL